MRASADLVLVNASVITLDSRCPYGEVLVVRSGRVFAVGRFADLRGLIGPTTEVVDAEGGIALPAFHDAHMHLLSYARSRSRLDLGGALSVAEVCMALAEKARRLPKGTWIRGIGYDETQFPERRHLNRHDLDVAVPNHPVRVQHRTFHLDVLNTPALRSAGLLDASGPQVERDPCTGKLTGRLFHAAELFRDRLPRGEYEDLSRDVRLASERLLSWGVTSIQDATVTNGLGEWELFHRLTELGELQVRVFFMPGVRHWRETAAGRPSSSMVRRGPVKFMLDETMSNGMGIRWAVAEVRAAGHAVALHAVSEAEVVMALSTIRDTPSTRGSMPDRIEHGAVIPDDLLSDLHAARVFIVGQPALVYLRGDQYRLAYPAELHGWLYRARSLVEAGVPYAIGSDAPVTEPSPVLGLFGIRRRVTRSGQMLGADEVLELSEDLKALTLEPARAVGALELGSLGPGAVADVVVLDPDVIEAPSPEVAFRPARLTVMDGGVVWRRPTPAADEG